MNKTVIFYMLMGCLLTTFSIEASVEACGNRKSTDSIKPSRAKDGEHGGSRYLEDGEHGRDGAHGKNSQDGGHGGNGGSSVHGSGGNGGNGGDAD